jgi:SAM-dependent methyltransferase
MAESLDRMADAANYNEWLLRRAQPFLGSRVLDVGAGVGTLTELVQPGRTVVAVEPDPEFVPLLRQRFAGRSNVRVVEADAAALDTIPESFDSVICFNVLEHISDDESALRHFRERLVPGGHLLLLVPAHQALFGAIDASVGHERRYSRDVARSRLIGAGLEPVEIRYVNPLGALGWLVSSRLLSRTRVPVGPLRLYDRLVPLLRRLDGVRLPFGLSVWAVARRPRE